MWGELNQYVTCCWIDDADSHLLALKFLSFFSVRVSRGPTRQGPLRPKNQIRGVRGLTEMPLTCALGLNTNEQNCENSPDKHIYHFYSFSFNVYLEF